MYYFYLVATLFVAVYGGVTDENKQNYKEYVEKVYVDNNDEFFASKEYLNLIPTDKNWINNELVNIPKQYKSNKEADEALLDKLDISQFEQSHKYSSTIQEAIDLFNKWRKWENGVEWVERKSADDDLKIYSKSVENEPIDIIKGDVTFNYPMVTVTGILLNIKHRAKWDKNLKDVKYLDHLSSVSRIVYASMQSPTLVSDREILSVSFAFPLEDGSIIIGSRSLGEDNEYEEKIKNDNHVRAFCNLALWHIRPDYDSGNLKQTKVTYYTQVSLNGYLPNMLVNQVSVDLPMTTLKLREYIKEIYSDIHKPGILNVPPYPCLYAIGVNIDAFFNKGKKK
eukprot:831243_1